jgi:hypothetical protein
MTFLPWRPVSPNEHRKSCLDLSTRGRKRDFFLYYKMDSTNTMEIDKLAEVVRQNTAYMQKILTSLNSLTPEKRQTEEKMMTLCKLQTEKVQGVIDALMTGDAKKVEAARADLTSMTYIIQTTMMF